MLLDATQDVEAMYLLMDYQNTEPFIDLNIRNKKTTKTGGGSIGKQGRGTEKLAAYISGFPLRGEDASIRQIGVTEQMNNKQPLILSSVMKLRQVISPPTA